MPSHTTAERKKNRTLPKLNIDKAIKRPGAFTARAKKAGDLTGKGTIKKSFTLQQAKKPGLAGQQARFALTLAKVRPKKKK